MSNGPRAEDEDTVKEQDDLSSASSVSLNSMDESRGEREADLLKKKYIRTYTPHRNEKHSVDRS